VLVYGDRARRVSPKSRLAEVAALLRPGEVGRARHDRLVRALIEAGELAQGLADAEFAVRQIDDHTPLQAAALALSAKIACKVGASWGSGFADAGPGADRELADLAALAPAQAVSCKQAEGFAHYAVYPEAYYEAACALRGAAPFVIGIRSIGVTLGAAVAAAAEASGFVTLRPHGHPFDRQVRVSDELKALLAAHDGVFAIVDEGPGLSGTSFGAVADLLATIGVADARLVFMPSHGGAPGHHAPARRQALWANSRRLVRTLDDLAPPATIAGWFEGDVGEASGVEDLSHGGWRRDLPLAAWPPIWPGQERRKLRLTTPSGVYLARFAGLGACGEQKLQTARLLSAAGFSPEPLSLRQGFLLERWLPGAPPTPAQIRTPAFQHRLAAYQSFRARMPPPEQAGARLGELVEMALVNTEEACGPAVARRLEARLLPAAEAVQALRPTNIDGRLHAWEWRCGPGGAIHKTDAVDHAQGHDLVGCQDAGWDVAGAVVELDLSAEEADVLVRRVAGVSPATVDLFTCLYCAFQTGLWAMASGAGLGDADLERARAHAQRYLVHLRRWADRPPDPHAASAARALERRAPPAG
jgi:hypothetical protein